MKTTGDPLEIQTRQVRYFDRQDVSVNSAVAMNVAGDRVGIYVSQAGNMVRVNGSAGGPGALPHGGTIEPIGGDLGPGHAVRWPDGSVAEVAPVGSWGIKLDVSLADARRGAVTGLLGNFDGDPKNDLVTRDGRQLEQPPAFAELYREFGRSWRITAADSLFEYAPGESNSTFTEADFPARPVAAADLPGRDSAEQVCRAAGVTDEVSLRECTLDVALTGQASLLDNAAHTQSFLGLDGEAPIPPQGNGNSFTIAIGDSVGANRPEGAGRLKPRERQVFGFDGRAGQVVYVRHDTGDCRVDWSLLRPDGAEIVRTEMCVDITRQTLPVDGRYTIVLAGFTNAEGPYGFTLIDVPPDGRFAISTGDTVSAGHPTGAGSLRVPGEHHVFGFDGNGGEKVIATHTIGPCGLEWSVTGPDGAELNRTAMCADLGTIVLPATGRYTITVYGFQAATGDYGFSLTKG